MQHSATPTMDALNEISTMATALEERISSFHKALDGVPESVPADILTEAFKARNAARRTITHVDRVKQMTRAHIR